MLCEKNKHQHHHHYYDDYDDDCSYCLCCLEPQELTTRFHYSVSSNCLVLRTAWAPKWTSQDLFGPSCFGFKLTLNPLAQLTCVGSEALANLDKLPPKSRITHAPREESYSKLSSAGVLLIKHWLLPKFRKAPIRTNGPKASEVPKQST